MTFPPSPSASLACASERDSTTVSLVLHGLDTDVVLSAALHVLYPAWHANVLQLLGPQTLLLNPGASLVLSSQWKREMQETTLEVKQW